MRRDVPLGLVAIGASAGGIEAFRQFFEKMPPDSGLAFVVVLHLPTGRKSMLPGILGRWTGMSVAEARDGAAIRANHVLVIPAGAVAELRNGHVLLRHLTPDSPRIVARLMHSSIPSPRAWQRTRSASFCRAPAMTARWGSRRSRRGVD
jgi:chemotaxis response regulator CheB